jgi:hypothetical protein
LIKTPRGERLIEDLKPGDLVMTIDHGLQPIRWIGRRSVVGRGRFTPIRVSSMNKSDAQNSVLVSPEHRVLFKGYLSQLHFGTSEVLIAAKHLIGSGTAFEAPCAKVTYIHIMFDQHEIVYSNGIPTESFFAGEIGLNGIEDSSRDELFGLFPELRTRGNPHKETARSCLKKYEANILFSQTA